MMWIFRIFLIGLLTLVVAGIMAFAGEVIWWLAVLTAALLYFGEAFVIRRAFGKLIEAPFKMKGAVLRDAQATIHSIKPAERPSNRSAFEDEDDEDEEEPAESQPDADHVFFKIDVTITPAPNGGNFTHWEPLELAIVPEDAPPANEDEDEVNHGVLHHMEVFNGNRFVEEEGMKYPGPQRLRILLGVPPAVQRAKFRYYFEDFGKIEFPRVGRKT